MKYDQKLIDRTQALTNGSALECLQAGYSVVTELHKAGNHAAAVELRAVLQALYAHRRIEL